MALPEYGFTQPPQVVCISPTFNQIASTRLPQISAIFSVPMDPSTFTQISYAVFGERSGYVTGTIAYDSVTRNATFTPHRAFVAGEGVNVNLSRSIKSQTLDSLKGFTWTFRIPVTHPTQGTFRGPVVYDGFGYGVQCVDMNRDGRPDIITSGGVIRLNSGGGQFNMTWSLPDADGFEQIMVDDFNRDGFMDVLYKGNGIKVGLGNGNGQFLVFTKPIWFDRYVTLDMNSDGFPDIVGARIQDTTSTLSISFNDGFGHFNDTVSVSRASGWYRQMEKADIDNDGDIDVLVISQKAVDPNGEHGYEGIVVFKNDGNHGFPQVNYYRANVNLAFPEYLGVADFSNDHYGDAVVLGNFVGVVSLNLMNGILGTDSTSIRRVWGAETLSPFCIGDFNGDTWTDILVSGYRIPFDTARTTYYSLVKNCAGVFRGCGTPSTFQDTLGYDLRIAAVQAADVDGDGDLDLVNAGGGVLVCLNEDSTLTVDEYEISPSKLDLLQNYPNPFNAGTTISFHLSAKEKVRLTIYNIIGKEVKRLHDDVLPPGWYKTVWYADDARGQSVPSGVYVIRLELFRSTMSLKSLLLK
ncbi:MAG: VCBS repeat-containing protein [Ignavibacteriae bacterium]|nr:VCBS repeat-containing protein [Ignavibacteriota bacterium]